MKYKKTVLVIIILISISISISILCIICTRSQSFDYDNSVPISIAFNKRYSNAQIKYLEAKILPSNILPSDISFSYFNMVYKPKVVRKTGQGYYAVLISKDNSFCFVFWNFENEIYSIYRTNGFVSSEVFSKSIEIGKTTLNDMKESGFDFFGYPSSKRIATAHICKDGIIVVNYDKNFVAVSVDVYTNQELLELDDYLTDIVPYILPEDKTITGQGMN